MRGTVGPAMLPATRDTHAKRSLDLSRFRIPHLNLDDIYDALGY